MKQVLYGISLFFMLALGACGIAVGQQTGGMEIESRQADGVDIYESPVDSQKVDLMLEYGLQAIDNGRISKARNFFRRIEYVADSLDFEYARQLSLYGFGDLYLVQQKYDSARTVLEEAVGIDPFSPLQHRIKNLLATSYRYEGNNQKAISLYREALSLIDTTAQVRTAAGIALNMGDAYMNMGASGEAFENYNKAIAFVEQSEDSVFLATTLNNVGDSHNSIGEYEEAAYYLERSLEISRESNFKPGQLRALLNLGNTRSSQSRFSEAEKLYAEALEISKQIRPDTPPLQIQYNLGELYNRMGSYDEAEKYFRTSLENSRKYGVDQGIYYNSTGLGNVQVARQDTESAVQYFEQALEIAVKLQNPVFSQSSHEKLYELQKELGNYEKALSHHENLKVISDSLNTQEKERLLADQKTRLEVQRKDQINRTLEAEREAQQAQLELQYWLLVLGGFILLLLGVFLLLLYRSNREKNKINSRLQEQKGALEEANAVKNKLLSIVAHDLRTPLSALTGMVELMREQSMSEEEMRELFGEMEFSLQQNMNIMENLLAWAKQQMSGMQVSPKALKVKQLVDEIMESHRFNAQHKGITLRNVLDEEMTATADYEMLKLVLRNLISNSIKFSSTGDSITVNGSQERDEVRLIVKDTGIGIPEDVQAKIFNEELDSRRGTSEEKGSGLGLRLCKEFMDKQGGSISFESREGEGTTFTILLPAPAYNGNGQRGQNITEPRIKI